MEGGGAVCVPMPMCGEYCCEQVKQGSGYPGSGGTLAATDLGHPTLAATDLGHPTIACWRERALQRVQHGTVTWLLQGSMVASSAHGGTQVGLLCARGFTCCLR